MKKYFNKIEYNYNGYNITNSHDISYDEIYCKKYQKFKFHTDDVILRINNQYVSDNGKIYSDIFKMNINFSTYCLLYGYVNDVFHIVYLRNNKISDCYIKNIDIDNILPYHINSSSHFLCYEGFIFTELSDRLFEYFKEHKITIYGEINTFRNDKMHKYVALVHVDYNYLKLEYREGGCEDLEQRNFPYPNNKIFILNKIGNENVTDLNSLKTILFKKKFEKQTTYNYNTMYNEEKNVTDTITVESARPSTRPLSHHIRYCA